jgi:hypothetical protein
MLRRCVEKDMAANKKGSPENPLRLNGADEWLLGSIRIYGKAGATLRDVIAAGDMLNRAIFSAAELRGGFAKLLAARCIRRNAGKWYLRETGRNPRVVGDSTSWPDPRRQDPQWSYPLSDREIEEAVQEYLEPPKSDRRKKR